MQSRILLLDEAPSVFIQLETPLQAGGHLVEIVGDTPSTWPLSGPDARQPGSVRRDGQSRGEVNPRIRCP